MFVGALKVLERNVIRSAGSRCDLYSAKLAENTIRRCKAAIQVALVTLRLSHIIQYAYCVGTISMIATLMYFTYSDLGPFIVCLEIEAQDAHNHPIKCRTQGGE